jgi:putative transposase
VGAAYGSPRVHRELRARGIRVSKKRVERLMRENDLVARQKTPRRAHYRFSSRVSYCAQRARSEFRREAWVGDVTYIPTAEGWLYLAVLDLFSRRVVG